MNRKKGIKKEIWDRTHNSTAIKKMRKGNSQERQIYSPVFEMRDLLEADGGLILKNQNLKGFQKQNQKHLSKDICQILNISRPILSNS